MKAPWLFSNIEEYYPGIMNNINIEGKYVSLVSGISGEDLLILFFIKTLKHSGACKNKSA